jgi:hypothetical protein
MITCDLSLQARKFSLYMKIKAATTFIMDYHMALVRHVVVCNEKPVSVRKLIQGNCGGMHVCPGAEVIMVVSVTD